MAGVFDNAAMKNNYASATYGTYSFSGSVENINNSFRFSYEFNGVDMPYSNLYDLDRVKIVFYKQGLERLEIAYESDYTIEEGDILNGYFQTDWVGFADTKGYVAIIRIYAVPQIDLSQYVTFVFEGDEWNAAEEGGKDVFLIPVVQEIMENGDWKILVHTKYELLLTSVEVMDVSYGLIPEIPFGGFYIIPAPTINADGTFDENYNIRITAEDGKDVYGIIIEETMDGVNIILVDSSGNYISAEDFPGFNYRRVENLNGTYTFDFYFDDETGLNITDCQKGDAESANKEAGIVEMSTGKKCGYVIYDPNEGDVSIRVYVEDVEE